MMRNRNVIWWIILLGVGLGACEGPLDVREGSGRIRLTEKTTGPIDLRVFSEYGYLLRLGTAANPGDTLTYEEGGTKPGLRIGSKGVEIGPVPVGPVVLELTNYPERCAVSSANPVDIVVPNRRRVEVEFDVKCQ